MSHIQPLISKEKFTFNPEIFRSDSKKQSFANNFLPQDSDRNNSSDNYQNISTKNMRIFNNPMKNQNFGNSVSNQFVKPINFYQSQKNWHTPIFRSSNYKAFNTFHNDFFSTSEKIFEKYRLPQEIEDIVQESKAFQERKSKLEKGTRKLSPIEGPMQRIKVENNQQNTSYQPGVFKFNNPIIKQNQQQSIIQQQGNNCSFTIQEASIFSSQVLDDASILKDKVISVLNNYHQQVSENKPIYLAKLTQDYNQISSEYSQLLDKYSMMPSQDVSHNDQLSLANQSFIKPGSQNNQNVNSMMNLVTEFLTKFQPFHVKQSIQHQDCLDLKQLNGAIDDYLQYASTQDPMSPRHDKLSDDLSFYNENNMDVFCMNCQEYISLKEINDHSLKCSDQQNQIKQAAVIKKLHKLCNFILEKSQKLINQQHKCMLQNLMIQLLMIKQLNQIQQLGNFSDKLDQLIKIFHQKSLNQFNQRPTERKLQILAALNRLENFLIQYIPSIQSSINQKQFQSQQPFYNGDDILKTQFFDLVIECKQKLTNNNIGKYCLISELYDEVQQKKIQPQKWKSFVEARLGL